MSLLIFLTYPYDRRLFPPASRQSPLSLCLKSLQCLAISTALHSVFTHLENNNTYIRMLSVDFSSAFNPISPMTTLHSYYTRLDIHTNRPQTVWIGGHTSSTLVLNTGAPQGCVLSPLLFTLYTHDCNPRHGESSVVKFADNTTIIGQITNEENSYCEEINNLAERCAENNLLLTVIIDFRKKEMKIHTPGYMNS